MDVMRSRFRNDTLVVLMGVGLGLASCTFARAGVIGWNGGFEASAGTPGRASQGYLGVDLRDVSDDELGSLKLKESRGAEVIRVDHDGPAGKVGLCEHDVILQMNGQLIEGEDQLRRMLRETPAGKTVTLVISRDGQQMTLVPQLANRLEVERKAWEDHWRVPEPTQAGDAGVSGGGGTINGPVGGGSTGGPRGNEFFSPAPAAKGHSFIGALTLGSSYTGATVETLGPQLAEFFGSQGAGVLVHSVDANSPAALAGLRAGDVVVRANTKNMTNSGDWMKIVRENRGKPLAVVVLRDKKEQTLTLIPDSKKRASVEPLPAGDSKPVVVAMRGGFAWK
jgi:serine protease Do